MKIKYSEDTLVITKEQQREAAALLCKNNVLRDRAKKIKDKKTLKKLIHIAIEKSGGVTARGGYYVDTTLHLTELCVRLGYKYPSSKAHRVKHLLRRINEKT